MAGGLWLTDMNGIFRGIWPKYPSKPRPDVCIYKWSFKALSTYKNLHKFGKMLGLETATGKIHAFHSNLRIILTIV